MAVIVWAPAASAEVVIAAVPEASSVAVPIGEPPSENVTVPVGVPAPGGFGLTVAVKVTGCPATDGFADAERAVVVAVAAGLTVWVSEPVLAEKLLSPP